MSHTPSCPIRLPPPPPPYEDFTSPYDVDYSVRGWLVTALLPPTWRAPPGARGAAPALVVCGAGGGGGQHVAPCIPLWLLGCPTRSWVVPGAPGIFAHVSKSTN